MKRLSDIVSEAACAANTTQALAREIIRAANRFMIEAVLSGESVSIQGFGVLYPSWFKGFRRSVRKGEQVKEFVRYRRIRFRAAHAFRELLRETTQGDPGENGVSSATKSPCVEGKGR